MSSVIRGSDNFDSLDSKGLGSGQTWQNMLSPTVLRALATNFTNTTGRPIFINVVGQGTNGQLTLLIGGVTFGKSSYIGNNISNPRYFISAVIPDGAVYQITGSGLTDWYELR